ncbi:lysosomal acid phosphatase-like [Uranotaenia lowii]|uniref:lysosomal acid phosphatase-like n=1 Tax=Uranotaenia lowii TaxID=190385 RepID=UPI002479D849|nr:lysosomal acid phosphatase-like [Uranotaenia lowii]
MMLTITTASKTKGLNSLRMVIILFRHGDRAPIKTYPTDPHLNYPWVGGLEALQPRGVEQAFELGRNFRNRYGLLLPSDGFYTRHKIHAISSYYERSIMSSQAVLAAFFQPPEDSFKIPIRWQPAALHVIPAKSDSILAQERPCPKFEAEFENFKRQVTPEFEEWYADSLPEFEYIEQHSGLKNMSWSDMALFYDLLEIENNYGLALPEWVKRLFPTKAIEYYKGILKTYSSTPIMKRLRGGATLSEFLSKLKAKAAGNLDPDRSIFLYSGHDLTQVSLLDSMGVLEQASEKPSFASAVVFELHENPSLGGQQEVRILHYGNWSVQEPKWLDIPRCPAPCSLSKFETAMHDIILQNYDEECTI